MRRRTVQKVVLAKEDLLIDMAQVPGFVSEGDNFVTVVLDTNLTPELIEEGFVRELISKIQTMRKEAGFEVMDHISVFQDGNDKLAEILKNHAEEIKKEVLADNILHRHHGRIHKRVGHQRRKRYVWC